MDEVVGALEDQGLPPTAAATLSALAGPLTNGIRSFIHDRITALVQSDAFEQAWVEANRTAHAELVAALTGETDGAVEINEGAVNVNLAVLINTVKQQLVDAGFGIAERIPEVAASFTIVQSDDLATVQNLLGLLDNLSTWLPVVGLALLAAAVAISRDRRRWVLVSGLAVAGSMLLLGATLNAIRPIYLDALPESSSAAAAGAIYDQLVSFIRLALRGLGIVALTVAVVAWFSAPRGAGAAARAGLVRGIDGLRRGTTRAGLKTGKLGVTWRSTAARSALPSSASRRPAIWRRTTRPAVRRWRSCWGRPSCCSCSPSWRPSRRTSRGRRGAAGARRALRVRLLRSRCGWAVSGSRTSCRRRTAGPRSPRR